MNKEELTNVTSLTEREAEVYLSKEKGCSHQKIADELGIAKSTVDGLASRINDRVERAYRTIELVGSGYPLTRSKTDPTVDDYLGLDWTKWISLNDIGTLPARAGIYRIRHSDFDGLVYIGETGRSLRGRIQALKRGTFADEMPYSDPHVAAPCLYAINQDYEGEFDVSVAMPSVASVAQYRKGIEATILAVYRREYGESPVANFGSMIQGWTKSSVRSSGDQGKKVEGTGDYKPSASPLEWKDWRDVISHNWMGLEWSRARQLSDRLDVSNPEAALYRIWDENGESSGGSGQALIYIGQTANPDNRLYTHEKNFGGDMLFSVAGIKYLDEQHQRMELETDLLGAHYMAVGLPPHNQFGAV